MQSPSPLELLVGSLAVWRLAALLAYERGPAKLFRTVRTLAGVEHFDDGEPDLDSPKGELGTLLTCVWCSSPWLAILWLAGMLWVPAATMAISTVLAVSAGAVIAERMARG